ncbi:hypothetical protein EBZ38_09625 [bacterium]|nr:hypothetical protein [bacterium]NDD84513.1 hypothetical protein [bacterium]NDG19296.1 hypothetical protein [Betaproteobacteria bacterium]
MTSEEVIRILRNRARWLETARRGAVDAGDLAGVNSFDVELADVSACVSALEAAFEAPAVVVADSVEVSE